MGSDTRCDEWQKNRQLSQEQEADCPARYSSGRNSTITYRT